MTAYTGWAIVELMGHRQRPGQISEVEMYGGKLLRIDIPVEGGDDVTEFYGGSAIYSVRPVSEEIARDMAKSVYGIRPVKPVQYQVAHQEPPPEPPPYRGEESDEDLGNAEMPDIDGADTSVGTDPMLGLRMDSADVGEDDEYPF